MGNEYGTLIAVRICMKSVKSTAIMILALALVLVINACTKESQRVLVDNKHIGVDQRVEATTSTWADVPIELKDNSEKKYVDLWASIKGQNDISNSIIQTIVNLRLEQNAQVSLSSVQIEESKKRLVVIASDLLKLKTKLKTASTNKQKISLSKAISALKAEKLALDNKLENVKIERDRNERTTKRFAELIQNVKIDKDLHQSKINYEENIINNVNSHSLIYDPEATRLVDVMIDGRLQCFSGTEMFLLFLLSKLSSSEIDELHLVVINLPAHELLGYIVKEKDGWVLNGIEMTAEGRAKKIFGSPEKVSKDMRITDARLYMLSQVLKSSLTEKSKKEILVFSEKQMNKEYGFDIHGSHNATIENENHNHEDMQASNEKSDIFNNSLFSEPGEDHSVVSPREKLDEVTVDSNNEPSGAKSITIAGGTGPIAKSNDEQIPFPENLDCSELKRGLDRFFRMKSYYYLYLGSYGGASINLEFDGEKLMCIYGAGMVDIKHCIGGCTDEIFKKTSAHDQCAEYNWIGYSSYGVEYNFTQIQNHENNRNESSVKLCIIHPNRFGG